MAQGTQGTVDMATLALDYWDDSQESEELLVPSFSKNWLGCMVYNYMVYIYNYSYIYCMILVSYGVTECLNDTYNYRYITIVQL